MSELDEALTMLVDAEDRIDELNAELAAATETIRTLQDRLGDTE